MSKVTIKGTVMWAQLEKTNEMSGKYQIDLCELSDAAVAALEALEISVNYKEGKGSFITPKSQRTIRAYDTDGSIIDGSVVGNGSEFVATITPYDWNFRGKSGVSPNLGRLVITKLEMYEDGDSGDAPDLDEAL